MPSINPENRPPTAQKQEGGEATDDGLPDWKKLGQDAFRSSTSYIDNNLRAQWEDSLRAFHSQHAAQSKYNSQAFEKRSRLFRPKTRTVIRKNEAAAAAAFFSNMEVVDIQAIDPDQKEEQASAEIMKNILEYRLTKNIKWFHTVLGGLQDAQAVGVVCAHVYWEYLEKPQASVPEVSVQAPPNEEEEHPLQPNLPEGVFTLGNPEAAQAPPAAAVTITQEVKPRPIKDHPVVKLLPVENLRIDPAADWTNPIESSPYVIELMPTYIMDVKNKIESGDWLEVTDGQLNAATTDTANSTRLARQNGKEDPTQQDSKSIFNHQIVWVQRHIHRHNNEDWEFYMLGEDVMLSDPVPRKQNVLHGIRPYVMGCCILETHRTYPASVATLSKDLQEQTNEIANQRIDNVKFVLNKKWFVKRGKDADIGGLVRNVPGGVVMLDDPDKDVREISFPDVTQSAYEEQSRLDNDFSELVGNFSAAQVMADHGVNGPARNMQMLNQSSGTLVEYLLRTYTETFIQPVLRQLVQLEQAYETDEVILALAAKKAGLFQKYGINEVTDSLLEKELTLTVNVGMGATDPQMKLQKFMAGMTAYVTMLEKKVAGVNMQEVGKEIFGHLGYGNATRFFTTENPQVIQLTQQLQQANQKLQQLQLALQNKQDKLLVDVHKITTTNTTKLEDRKMKEAGENQRNVATHLRALTEMQAAQRHDMTMKHLDRKHEVGMNQMTMKDNANGQ
jgi:hypothetical protein